MQGVVKLIPSLSQSYALLILNIALPVVLGVATGYWYAHRRQKDKTEAAVANAPREAIRKRAVRVFSWYEFLTFSGISAYTYWQLSQPDLGLAALGIPLAFALLIFVFCGVPFVIFALLLLSLPRIVKRRSAFVERHPWRFAFAVAVVPVASSIILFGGYFVYIGFSAGQADKASNLSWIEGPLLAHYVAYGAFPHALTDIKTSSLSLTPAGIDLNGGAPSLNAQYVVSSDGQEYVLWAKTILPVNKLFVDDPFNRTPAKGTILGVSCSNIQTYCLHATAADRLKELGIVYERVPGYGMAVAPRNGSPQFLLVAENPQDDAAHYSVLWDNGQRWKMIDVCSKAWLESCTGYWFIESSNTIHGSAAIIKETQGGEEIQLASFAI